MTNNYGRPAGYNGYRIENNSAMNGMYNVIPETQEAMNGANPYQNIASMNWDNAKRYAKNNGRGMYTGAMPNANDKYSTYYFSSYSPNAYPARENGVPYSTEGMIQYVGDTIKNAYESAIKIANRAGGTKKQTTKKSAVKVKASKRK